MRRYAESHQQCGSVYSLTGQRIGVKVTGKEWSRYYHHPGIQGLEVLHARFVEHRYPRHAHHYFVIAFVESGAASYRYRGAQHVAPAGHVSLSIPTSPTLVNLPDRAATSIRRFIPVRTIFLEWPRTLEAQGSCHSSRIPCSRMRTSPLCFPGFTRAW